MNTVKELLKRTVAVLILLTMIVSRLLMAGFGLVSYAIDNMRTSNENVEILAYFENEKGEKVVDIQERIDKPLNLKIDVVMKNTHGYGGYFDGDIEIANANFKLKDETEMKVHLNAGETTTIEREIEYLNPETNYEGYLNREATITVTGEYVNSKGNYEVEGTAGVKVNWVSEENIEGRISGEVLTNKVYQEDKRIVQLLIDSKLENSSYPVKSVHEEIEIPEGSENVKVHKRVATDVNKGIKYTTDEEQRKTIIEIEDTIEPIVVTYEIPNSVNLEEKKLETKGKITLYDGREIEANTEIEVKNEEKEGSITNKLIEKEEEIYKGKIYTGEKRQYSDAVKVYVDYIEAIEKIEIKDTKTVYVNDKNEETEANIRYESTVINKKEFDSILGETGYITVKDHEGNVIANINKETEVKENGNIVIEYGENTKNISIITSKPVNTGIFNIINNKKIEENKTREEIEKIEGIKEKVEVNGKESEKIIKLKEPQTELGFNVEETRIEVGNKKDNVKMEIDLIGNSEERELYKDPNIQIVFPEEVKNVQARYRMLYSNGLKIEKGIIQEQNGRKVLTFNIKGEQTKYPSQVEEGTKILIYSDLEIDEKANTGEKDIVLNYKNNKTEQGATGTKTAKINIEEKTIPVVKRNMNLLGAPNTNTNEETGIKTTLEASVGNDILENNDEVKAGEVIRYRITVENTGTQNLEGITIKGQVPEGTTRVIVNKAICSAGLCDEENADNENYYEDDYNEEDEKYYNETEDRTVSMQIDLNAGETKNVEYEIRANNNIQGDITNTVQILKNSENLNEISITHKLIKGDISLKVYPIRRKKTEENVELGKTYLYEVEVKNNTNEDKENIPIEILSNGIFEIKNIVIERTEETAEESINNSNTATISKLSAGETRAIKLTLLTKQTEDNSNIATINVISNYNNLTYRSNRLIENLKSIKLEAKLEGSVKNEYVLPGDEIAYVLTVNTSGDINDDEVRKIKIIEEISENLNIERVVLNNRELNATEYKTFEKEDILQIIIEKELNIGEEIKLQVYTKLNNEFLTYEDIKLASSAKVNVNSLEEHSNEIIYTIKGDSTYDDVDASDDEDDIDQNNDQGNNTNSNQENNSNDNQGNNSNDNQGNNSNNNQGNNSNNNQENSSNSNQGNNSNEQSKDNTKRTISGTAWLDENGNGIRESNEETFSGIEVNLINITTSKIIETKQTNADGTYTFYNVTDGNYIVIFKYDTNKYITTIYQSDKAQSSNNSDATTKKIKIGEDTLNAGATDTLVVNKDMSNIDIGLTTISKPNLVLEKTVSKITVKNSKGTSTYNYIDEDLAKVEIPSRYLKGSTVLIEYTIKVKNTGNVSGKIGTIVDNYPSVLKFTEGINKGWYQNGNKLYNEDYAGEEIKPGETKEVKLLLSIVMTESNTGLVNNIAEMENLKDSADVIIGIRTGSLQSYLIITCIITGLISLVPYITYKKIFKKREV